RPGSGKEERRVRAVDHDVVDDQGIVGGKVSKPMPGLSAVCRLVDPAIGGAEKKMAGSARCSRKRTRIASIRACRVPGKGGCRCRGGSPQSSGKKRNENAWLSHQLCHVPRQILHPTGISPWTEKARKATPKCKRLTGAPVSLFAHRESHAPLL